MISVSLARPYGRARVGGQEFEVLWLAALVWLSFMTSR